MRERVVLRIVVRIGVKTTENTRIHPLEPEDRESPEGVYGESGGCPTWLFFVVRKNYLVPRNRTEHIS